MRSWFLSLLAPALLFSSGWMISCGEKYPPPQNVLFITVDTLRADHLGCYGHEAIETPAIDRLASEGTLYENVFTAVPITLPSHTTIFTGIYPIAHGVRENGGFYVPDEALTLAEILHDQGYDTAAFVGSFPLDSQTGIDQGFDLYDDNYPTGTDDRRHPRADHRSYAHPSG